MSLPSSSSSAYGARKALFRQPDKKMQKNTECEKRVHSLMQLIINEIAIYYASEDESFSLFAISNVYAASIELSDLLSDESRNKREIEGEIITLCEKVQDLVKDRFKLDLDYDLGLGKENNHVSKENEVPFTIRRFAKVKECLTSFVNTLEKEQPPRIIERDFFN